MTVLLHHKIVTKGSQNPFIDGMIIGRKKHTSEK